MRKKLNKLAHDRRAWTASLRDAASSIGKMWSQVQIADLFFLLLNSGGDCEDSMLLQMSAYSRRCASIEQGGALQTCYKWHCGGTRRSSLSPWEWIDKDGEGHRNEKRIFYYCAR